MQNQKTCSRFQSQGKEQNAYAPDYSSAFGYCKIAGKMDLSIFSSSTKPYLAPNKAICADCPSKLNDDSHNPLCWSFGIPGNMFKGIRQQSITSQDGDIFAIDFVVGGHSSSQVVIVLKRKQTSSIFCHKA
jgi:hypothetical protein